MSNFQKIFGAPPEPFSNYAYDVANIAGLSILTAGTDNATALLPIVLTVSDHYFGASGTHMLGCVDGSRTIEVTMALGAL